MLRLLAQDVAHQICFAAVIHLGELLCDSLGNDAVFFHNVLSHPAALQLDPVAVVYGNHVSVPLAAGGFDGVIEVNHFVHREQVWQVCGAD